MKLGHNNSYRTWIALSTLTALLTGNTAMAAPGILGNQPLILETAPVQPNIYFLVDDSGSMDWEDILNNGTQYPASAPVGNLDFSPNNALKKRLLCRGFNVMAYDPTVTYKPWAGVDSAGNAYTDLTLTTARDNPYSATTTDISSHVYVTWTDSDNDGQYDGPGSTDISSNSTVNDECDIGNPVAVNTLSTANQTNYANWYSYYRKREYVVKRALSQIIKDSTGRVGLGSLHNHNSIRTPVRDVDDITIPVDTTAQSNKSTILTNLFNIDSANGTPLRQSLKDVGEYFSGNMTATWGASPILSNAQGGQCQKNFTVVMSDGFWNGSSPSVGNTDGDNSSTYDGASYADSVSNTLADVAMKYYETDLDGDSTNNHVAPIKGIDENPAQHLVTYTIAFGVDGTLTANPPNRTDAFSWPTPTADTNTTIDDMRHAAWNGRGLFLNAGDPQKLITSLNNAIQDIDAHSRNSSAAALNTTSLQDNSKVYIAGYTATGWNGTLTAQKIDASGVKPYTDGGWEAGAKLDAIDSASNNLLATRKIYTYNGTGMVELKTELATSGTLAAGQLSDLLADKPAAASNSTYLSSITKFIYGDHVDEIGNGGLDYFRNRGNHRLGDIIHSAPIFVGAPNAPYPDNLETATYSSFKSTYSSRSGTIYVGSNDGMLHAFKQSDGSERFAYIPSMLFSSSASQGLHYLASTTYAHKYYVDLTPTVSDVFVGSAWKTMLVGGLRGGGKGIFVLDVTDETSPALQFEYTNTDLGYAFSDIQIAKMNNGKWAAIFGNGYNNTGSGKAKLFIVYLDNTGSKIIDTDTGSISNGDCADASSDCNGLSTPALADLNGDGKIDRIYAGDVQGNMWAFDVSNGSDSSWVLANSSTSPLFSACRSTTSPCPAADRQSITTKPALARHPTQHSASTFPNLLVMFGTGQFLANGDLATTATQSVYGVWDRASSGLDKSNLVMQTISSGLSKSGATIRTVTDLNVNYVADAATTKYGWYFTLPESKERVVVNPVAYGSMLFINTMIPQAPELCAASNGSGWLMAIDISNGGQPDFQPIDVNNDNQFTDLDALTSDSNVYAIGTKVDGIPTESKFVSDKRITVDSDMDVNIQSVQGLPPSDPSRMSWTSMY